MDFTIKFEILLLIPRKPIEGLHLIVGMLIRSPLLLFVW